MFYPQRVSDYLQTTFDYLNGPASVSADLGYPSDGGRMVQQWLWYKLWVNGAGTASNLLVDDYATYSPGDPNALTIIGERYRDYTAAHPLQANLFPYQVGFSEVSNSAVDIHVSVMNNGNTATATGITVGVYADPDHNTLIGVANLGSVDGCARQELTATVRWDNLPPGQHTFYLAIDPANTISETNEDDNSVTGVIISGQKIYLPQLRTGY